MISIKLLGAEMVIKNMWLTHAAMGKRFEAGLKKAGEFVKAESQKIVPVDTGALQASAKNVNIGGRGWKADQVVSYGDSSVFYARIVHERRDVHHAPPTQAGYLELIIRTQQTQILMTVYKTMITGK